MTSLKGDILATQRVQQNVWHEGALSLRYDLVADEMPAALVYNGISHLVMMVTPADLEVFALGFSLTEGIIQKPEQMLDFKMVAHAKGLELQLQITNEAFANLKHRRRQMVGRTGCGLCGEESLDQMVSELPKVSSDLHLSHQAIKTALAKLPERQHIRQQTGAVHAAAWCDSDGNVDIACEDVGRHNAVDKVLGTLAKNKLSTGDGFLLVSSRIGYEIVAKAAAANVGILVGVSAPTALAISLAEACGMGLIGFARENRQVVYSHRQRFY